MSKARAYGIMRMGAGASAAACAFAAAPAMADAPVQWDVAYKADVIGGWTGEGGGAGRFLDNLDLKGDFDLERLAHWRGASAHLHILNNSGAAPNDVQGTLQGVDNIEVAQQRTRLFEAWLEQGWDGGSVRAGLYDLNSEFYANEAAGLLIAPAFGIGSELAATGPNGPSIFPSTALGVRFAVDAGPGVARFAAINAEASVFGDPDGVDTEFDYGALLIGEYAAGEDQAFAIGAWRYTREQDDLRDVDVLGAPEKRTAYGVYATYQQPLNDYTKAFARVGFSDGDTTPYIGGWQAGILVDAPFVGRPDGVFSLGVYQGRLSAKQRANARDAGEPMAHAETGVEVTYSDRLAPWFAIQPDVQVVLDPGGAHERDALWVAGMRFVITPCGGDQ